MQEDVTVRGGGEVTYFKGIHRLSYNTFIATHGKFLSCILYVVENGTKEKLVTETSIDGTILLCVCRDSSTGTPFLDSDRQLSVVLELSVHSLVEPSS